MWLPWLYHWAIIHVAGRHKQFSKNIFAAVAALKHLSSPAVLAMASTPVLRGFIRPGLPLECVLNS
jgi:hypothetical protein